MFAAMLQEKHSTPKVLDLKMPYSSHPYDLKNGVDTPDGSKAFKRDTANRYVHLFCSALLLYSVTCWQDDYQ